MVKATKPMSTILSGDCTRLPDSPRPQKVGTPTQQVATWLGKAAKAEGRWVGVSLQAIAERTDDPGISFPLMHPAAWVALNFHHPVARAFRQIPRTLVDVVDGYAYPTQGLVDILMTTVR